MNTDVVYSFKTPVNAHSVICECVITSERIAIAKMTLLINNSLASSKIRTVDIDVRLISRVCFSEDIS